MPKISFLVKPESGQDQRLDIFLSRKLSHLSRSNIQKLVEDQNVTVEGRGRKASYRLKKGETVEVDLVVSVKEPALPENIPLDLIYQDEHIAVIDKPSGMVVHPGAGNRTHTLVNALLFHFPEVAGVGPEERPGIVHRLDKETSGVMVAARVLSAYKALQRQFKAREVEKEYLGLVRGRMPEKTGKIDWAIGRHIKHGERISVKTKKPRTAETLYKVRVHFRDFSLLEIFPLTGRTHQIRVHLAASGHPLAGDTRYGRRKSKISCPRLFLHAHRLSFSHPETQEIMEFCSPLPHDLKEFLDKLSE